VKLRIYLTDCVLTVSAPVQRADRYRL